MKKNKLNPGRAKTGLKEPSHELTLGDAAYWRRKFREWEIRRGYKEPHHA